MKKIERMDDTTRYHAGKSSFAVILRKIAVAIAPISIRITEIKVKRHASERAHAVVLT